MQSGGERDSLGGNLTPAQQDWLKQFGAPGQPQEATVSKRFHIHKMSWRERDVVSLKMKKRRAPDAVVELSAEALAISPPTGMGELRAGLSQMATMLPGYEPAPVLKIPWSSIDGITFQRPLGAVPDLGGGGRYQVELSVDFGISELTLQLSRKQARAIRTLIERHGRGSAV